MSIIDYDDNSILLDLIVKYEQLLNDYTIRLFYGGLDLKDYSDIEKFIDEIHKINCIYSNDKLIDIEKRLRNIFLELHWLFRYRKLYEMMMEETSLVHAIFTNNKSDKMRFYTYDSIFFSCQFHKEDAPSMGVTSHKGLYYCYGCGYSGNIINYIMDYENLTFADAVGLLARIYLIDLDYNIFSEENPLVRKYQNALFSDEFRSLLDRRRDKLVKNYNPGDLRYIAAEEKYQKILNTIERIRRGEHIKYVTKKDKPKKLVYNLHDMFDETR